MTGRLFVYGTLRRGGRHSRFELLAPWVRVVGQGRMRGRLVDLGDYPAMISARTRDDWVRGEVYALDDPDRVLPELDEYEGCVGSSGRRTAFRRVLGDVWLDSGGKLRAWVYVYEGRVPRARIIASGDYLDRGVAR